MILPGRHDTIGPMMENIEEKIEHIPLFSGFNRRQKRYLSTRFVQRTYEPGQSIVTQDSMGAGMYIVLSGRAEAVRRRPDDSLSVVNTFGPTDFFGELALLAEGPRTATVTATEKTECLFLTRSDFLELLQTDAHMAITVAQELAQRFRQALATL